MALTKLKSQMSRFRPENKITFLLQNGGSRLHTSLRTTKHIASLALSVLSHPWYILDLVPSDYSLFGLMKDGLCEQNFPSNNTITVAGADFYFCSMQALFQCWQKCITNGGDYVEKIVFCRWEFALSNRVTVLFVAIVVSMEINKKHYFWSNLHSYQNCT